MGKKKETSFIMYMYLFPKVTVNGKYCKHKKRQIYHEKAL